MILEVIMEIIKNLLRAIFAVVPVLPTFSFLTNILTFFSNVILKGLHLLCFFIRPNTIIIGLGATSVLFVFKFTYFLVDWVVKKIPFLNIK